MSETISRAEEYQRSKFGDFGIKPGDSVLDIGSGENPFPLATVLADPFPEDNEFFRRRPLKRVPGIPFKTWSLYDIPCEDNSFDFVYCSHVLECLDFPDTACNELMRVGKRGYIECPSRFNEVLFGDKSHRWIVEVIDKVLTIQKMTEGERLHILHQVAWDMLTKSKELFKPGQHFADAKPTNIPERFTHGIIKIKLFYPELFYTMLLWDGSFEFKIID